MSIKKIIESPNTTTRKTLDEPKTELTPKKRVQFHGRVKRRFYDRVEEEDRANVWYSCEETSNARRFEDSLRDCVSVDKEFYFQSKEDFNAQRIMTHEQATKKYAKIDKSIDVVLAEQDEQESDFYDDDNANGELFALDDEKIAEAYRCHAYEALEQAQCRANRHARHLQEIENQPEQCITFSNASFVQKGSPTRLSPTSKKSIPEESSQKMKRTA